MFSLPAQGSAGDSGFDVLLIRWSHDLDAVHKLTGRGKELKPITYVSDQLKDYVDALSKVKTLAELRALTDDYAEIAGDAKVIADAMADTDFPAFLTGIKKERRGKFAGENFAEKYGPVLMPEILFRTSLVANKYFVPWGCAYIRMKESATGTDDQRSAVE